MPGVLEGCGGCCLTVILIPLLCCGLAVGALIYVDQNAPSPPVSTSFQPQQSEANAFTAEINRAVSDATNTGWFSMRIYENQMSSWMALEGARFAEENGHTYPFDDVQVGLDDGVITFYGELSEYGIDVPITVAVEPAIDASGDVTFDIETANIGGVRVPAFVLNSVAAQVQDALLQPLNERVNNVRIQDLRIYDDRIDIQGVVQP